MSSKFRDFISRARRHKAEDSQSTTQSDKPPQEQDDFIPSSTPLMNSSKTSVDEKLDSQKSDVNNEEKKSLIRHSEHVNRSNERLVSETPSVSSVSGLGSGDDASPVKSHGNGSSKHNLISGNDEKIQQSSDVHHSDPPLYSELGLAKLASFDRFDDTTIGSSNSPTSDADRVAKFDPTMAPSHTNGACDIDSGQEKDQTIDTNRLSLPGLQTDGSSSALRSSQNSDLTPSQKFMSVALAVQTVVRLSRLERAKIRAKWAGKKLLVFLLSHIGLTLLVLLYATAGGFLFRWLEMEEEVGRKKNMDEVRANYLLRMWNETVSLNVLHPVNWSHSMGIILKEFEKTIEEAISNGVWDGAQEDEVAKWTIPGSLLFSTTVITSIGYGDITPKTTAGKLVCIPFAILGIPLTLVCLANIGQLLAGCCRFAWRRITRCFQFVQNPNAKNKNKGSKHEKTRVPILVCICIMLSYLLLGAVLFSNWETGWSFLDGFYFCFVTLSTIGFGDFVPGQYETGTNERRVVVTVYLLLGLALLSTVFQLMIDSVMVVVGRYAIFFGLSKDQIDEDLDGMNDPHVKTRLVMQQDSLQPSKPSTINNDVKHSQDFNVTITGEDMDVADNDTDVHFHCERHDDDYNDDEIDRLKHDDDDDDESGLEKQKDGGIHNGGLDATNVDIDGFSEGRVDDPSEINPQDDVLA